LVIGERKGAIGLHPGDHVCWTYGSDQEHREVLTGFLTQGLKRNERVVYLGRRYSEDTVLSYLRQAGVADKQFRRLGQLVIEDLHQAVLGDGEFQSERSARAFQQAAAQAVADGYRGLRVAGETASLVPGSLNALALVEHEFWVTPTVASAPLTALCGYDTRFCDPDCLLAAQAVHPLRVTSASMRASSFHLGIGARGEVVFEGKADWSCRGAFQLALQAAAARGSSRLVLDLGQLGFIDLSCLRALVKLSQELAPQRRSLVLRSSSEVTQMIMHPSLGFDPPSNLHLC
jgi:anti-anti-sigma regulatory factor